MEEKNKDFALPENDFLAEQPPLEEELFSGMPELDLSAALVDATDLSDSVQEFHEDVLLDAEILPIADLPDFAGSPEASADDAEPVPVFVDPVLPEAEAFEDMAAETEPAPEQSMENDMLMPPVLADAFSEDAHADDRFAAEGFSDDDAPFESFFAKDASPEADSDDNTSVEAYTDDDSAFESFFGEDFSEDAALSADFDPAESDGLMLPFEEETFPDEAFREPDSESPEFEAAFSDAPAEEEQHTASGKVRPTRKGRPKRRKGYGFFGIPHLLATVVWLVIILAIGTTLGRFIWVCAADVLAFGRESSKVSVTITSNDTIEDIARKLQEAGLVRYPALFEFYAGIAVDEGDIIPGTFEMDTLYDYHALVVQMGPRSSNRAVVEDVLIPEGYNCRQIFALLEEKGICTVEELEEYAANGEFSDFWFLEGVERGDKYCLEGFLFPDTYDFYANSTPREALGKMLLGFENRFTEELYSQLPALNERLSNMMRKNGCSEEFIAAHQLELRDLLTVASLIEEETASVTESPTIASVIYNRLTQDLEYERYLGIDAAIIYATGDASNIDTSLNSPYNTYTNAGLTPGPITNPGLDSIRAALNPGDTNFYYYVLNPETYQHDFSVTLEEHEKKVEKYKAMTAGEEE